MKLEELVKIYKETQKPRTSPLDRTDWGKVSANTAFRQEGNIRSMADMLVKLAEFEVTEEFEVAVLERLNRIDDAFINGHLREICQAVIDQLREEL